MAEGNKVILPLGTVLSEEADEGTQAKVSVPLNAEGDTAELTMDKSMLIYLNFGPGKPDQGLPPVPIAPEEPGSPSHPIVLPDVPEPKTLSKLLRLSPPRPDQGLPTTPPPGGTTPPRPDQDLPPQTKPSPSPRK